MKVSTSFVCQECGYESPKYLGRCPECGLWNTLKEFKISNTKSKVGLGSSIQQPQAKPQKISEVSFEEGKRLSTNFKEMDEVLGGGIVMGSVILLAGDPGIGKSTLLLQVGLNLSGKNKVLYISGEESEEQIKMRSKRISKDGKN